MRLAFPKNIDQYFILRWLTSWWILNVAYLYKCWVSRTDCSICHHDSTAEPYLKCGWCKADTNKCVVQEACNEVGGFWIPYSLPCRTEPNITKVLERCLLGTLRSNDATATRTSPKKWICVLSVFISIMPTYLLCQSRRTVLRLNSKGPYPSWEREIKFRRCLFTFCIKREIRHFHVVVVQKRQKNVQKSVMHMQSCFAY